MGNIKLVKISLLAKAAGVPASTIKHYVHVGLLPPPAHRPNNQMAYYDADLADRIRAIRILQRERFLPLETIAKILGPPPKPGEERRETLRAEQLIALQPAVTSPTTRSCSRSEVLAEMPRLAKRDLDALTRAGLLPGSGRYTDAELELLKVVNDTRAAGLDHLFPLHVLAPYLEAVRGLVRLEIDMFRHCLTAAEAAPSQPLDEVATAATRLGERLVVALRRLLVPAEVRRLAVELGRGPAPPRRRRRKPGRR
jgi:DNA-binding transcriptional MerR regulator